MDKYKETSETWNKIAKLYQDKFMDLDLYNNSYDSFCNTITKNNAKILEIGCGPGNITKYILSKKPNYDVFGIDIAPNMIELAKINNPAASFSVLDCKKINTLKTTYDGIICGFCLPYLTQQDGLMLISDAYNLLTDNGVLYVSFVEGDPNKSDFQVGSSGDRIFFNLYTLNSITDAMINIGFDKPKIIKVQYKKNENLTDTHTILITTKKFVNKY